MSTSFCRAEVLTTPVAWGAQTRSSRRGFVFVEQAAEDVAPPDPQWIERSCPGRVVSAAALWRSQVECSVWTLLVEVAGGETGGGRGLGGAGKQEGGEGRPRH